MESKTETVSDKQFLKEKYVWVRSQDGGETLILREYHNGSKIKHSKFPATIK